jgi:hypothetical protein
VQSIDASTPPPVAIAPDVPADRAAPIGSALPAGPAAQLIEQTLFGQDSLSPSSAVQLSLPTPAASAESAAIQPPLTQRLPPP